MTEFTIHTQTTAPAGARDALGALEANIGFIPNLAATIAGSPAAMTGFVALQSALRTAGLGALEREVVGVTVSLHNRSRYSMAAHSTFAAGAGAGPQLLGALRAGDPLPDDRLEALREFTLAVLARDGHVNGEPLDAFLAAGFQPACALEVIEQIAYTTFANYAANAAQTPVDDAFAAQSWEGVEVVA
jgi:alkylhydroperoxidase family enzyme